MGGEEGGETVVQVKLINYSLILKIQKIYNLTQKRMHFNLKIMKSIFQNV